jgi:DNA helicase-2/ATP-dependent DNA helicase PcrA
VVIAGLEEGLFPHASAEEEDGGLEEERRLFYVALTRARDQVLLCAAAFRRRFTPTGSVASGGRVSRFVDEIPTELLEHEEPEGAGWSRRAPGATRGRARGRHPEAGVAVASRVATHRAVGRVVYHEQFGRGVVQDVDGEGRDLKFTVRFGPGARDVRKILGRFLTGGDDDDRA